LVVGFLWIGAASVDAHRVNVFAWVEGDTVYVESKFSGGKRVNAGKITVSDAEGTELLTGLTDENGVFSFKVPKKTDLKIVLEAGTGHKGEWTVAAGEIQRPASGKKPEPEKDKTIRGIAIGLGFIFGLTAILALIRKGRKRNKNYENTKI
jgi:nickel transport protein